MEPHHMRRILFIVIAIVTLGIGAVYYRLGATAAPSLVTATVTRGPVVLKVEATGTVQPVDSVEVGSQVTGTINSLGATFNSIVHQGQILATLDPAAFQAQVDQARAGLARVEAELQQAKVGLADAQIKLQRAERLSKDGLIPQADLDAALIARDGAQAAVKSAQAQVVQARASLAQAQVTLQRTVIKSPVDGIVLSRNVEVGQTVTSGLQTPTLFVIARDLGTMQVSASVDESDIGRVADGQPVTFTLDAYGSETFTGKVTEVRLQPVVTNNVVTYTAIITVPNPGQKLKPGMTATVRIETARDDDALRVPVAALRFRPDAELFEALGQEMPKRQGLGRQSEEPGSAVTGDRAATARRERGADNTARPALGTPGSRATIWQVVNGKLQPVRVTVGLSDGTQVAVEADRLEPGAIVVTGIRESKNRTAQTPTGSGSPLMPSMPRRGGRGL
jgi:HlyD family secretion protein